MKETSQAEFEKFMEKLLNDPVMNYPGHQYYLHSPAFPLGIRCNSLRDAYEQFTKTDEVGYTYIKIVPVYGGERIFAAKGELPE